MNAAVKCQRWRDRRASFRPVEAIDPSVHAVDVIGRETARAFVVTHHYSGSFPSARLSVGLFRGARLAGVAVFSVPSSQASVPARTGLPADQGVELGRFVLLDEVEGNGETWFLARARRIVQRELGVRALLSYSDPCRREAADGRVVMPGHVGTIYQASNAVYLGRTKSRTLYLSPDGRELPPRSLSKLRNGERGDGYAYQRLRELGASPRRRYEDARTYVARVMGEGVFRAHKHRGCHCYAWALDRSVRLAASQPYPKKTDFCI